MFGSFFLSGRWVTANRTAGTKTRTFLAGLLEHELPFELRSAFLEEHALKLRSPSRVLAEMEEMAFARGVGAAEARH